jgi:hypothetical protein
VFHPKLLRGGESHLYVMGIFDLIKLFGDAIEDAEEGRDGIKMHNIMLVNPSQSLSYSFLSLYRHGI